MADPAGRVCIAFDDGPLEPSPAWTRIDDIANLVAEIEISTGRQSERDATATGTAVVRLNDTTGLFDPNNTGSPYFGNLDGKQIAISLWDPVEAAWFIRFRGLIDDYGHDLNPATNPGGLQPGVSIVSNIQIQCVDVFDYLAGIEMIPGVHGDVAPAGSEGQVFYEDGEVDARIIHLIDTDAGLDPDMYVVFSGNINVQETKYDSEDTILVGARDAADAEFPGIANLFCDRRGRFVFHGRGARIDPDGVSGGAGPDAWDFQRWKAGDGAAITADADRAQIRPPMSFSRSRNRIINAALAYPMGVLETAIPGLVYSDAGSIADFGVHSWSASDLIILEHKTNGNTATDECLLFSTFMVENFKEPRVRVEALTFKAIHPLDPRATATWAILCRSDISDVIDLAVGYPGGDGIAEDFYIEGWTQTIRPLNLLHDMVELTLNVSPTAYYTEDVF